MHIILYICKVRAWMCFVLVAVSSFEDLNYISKTSNSIYLYHNPKAGFIWWAVWHVSTITIVQVSFSLCQNLKWYISGSHALYVKWEHNTSCWRWNRHLSMLFLDARSICLIFNVSFSNFRQTRFQNSEWSDCSL